MKLKDIIQKDLILYDIDASNNNDAIQELVELLVAQGKIPAENMTEALLSLFKREALGSTGIGSGVAIPHGRVNFVREVVGCLGISREGIDFRSIDNAPVHVVFLFLSPVTSTEQHLKMLSLVNSLTRSPEFIMALSESNSRDEVETWLGKAESIVFPRLDEGEDEDGEKKEGGDNGDDDNSGGPEGDDPTKNILN